MRTFSETLVRQAEAVPDRVAITLLDSRQNAENLTAYGLLCRSASWSRALAREGVQPGEIVVLVLPHGIDLIASFFGAILHGAVPSIMPFLTEKLSPERYRRSITALFDTTQPAAVITNLEFETEVRLAGEGKSSPRRILFAGQTVVPENENLSDLAGLSRRPEDIVLLQHSSGTTGLQKGVALSHQAVFNQLDSYADALHLITDDIVVSWLPLYHDMGLIAGFLMPILLGNPLVLMSPFDWVRAPYRLMQAVSRYKGSLTWLPNFAYNFCAQKIRDRDLEGVDLSSWRGVINCSEPMHVSSHQLFLDRFRKYGLRPEALWTCYAMAENVFAVSQAGPDGPVRVDSIDRKAFQELQIAKQVADEFTAMRMLSAGHPISNTRLVILDKQGTPLPDRHIGEIALSSNCMLTGYYKRPDLTKKAFHDEWYLTGDLGYLADGEVYITGRIKDLIIVGGKNVYPQDLERLASETPGVHPGRVAAFGVDNEETGTQDVVLIAESDLQPAAFPDVADAIRRRVTQGSDIALRNVLVVERNWLVKTSSGKVARGANKEKYQKMMLEGG
jgi:acyl-CoA synthetase (AMP-forming)/AMP-acid ligase II